MSTPTLKPVVAPVETPIAPRPSRPRRRWGPLLRRTIFLLAIAGALAGIGIWARHGYLALVTTKAAPVPTTRVRRGDVTFTITAKGALKGGNSEILTAPMAGGGDMHITYLRHSGDVVHPGDVVVKLDTTEQEYKLREAQSDLAEADQHVLDAQAQLQAQKEEDSYALSKAKSDVRQAELETRKNPLVAAITARQNDLALQQARDQLAELEKNLVNHQATNEAAIATQQAAKSKAEVQAATAKQNIESMTLTAHRAGYIAVKPSQPRGIWFGQALPLLQVGDTVGPGLALAEIPDLNNWEVVATIGELDRGHLGVGQQADVTIVPVPGKHFIGRIKDLGGTTGSPWDRHFDCHIVLEQASPELRPGMSAEIVVTTERMHNVLWLPAQAIFDRDGKSFVYVPSGSGFVPRDVKLVRRGESQAVVAGLAEHQIVALANPDEQAKKGAAAPASASQALRK